MFSHYSKIKFFVFSVVVVVAISTTYVAHAQIFPQNTTRTCEYTKLTISCPPDTEIIVNKAWYGRLSSAICPSILIYTTQCYRDATAKVASICNNRDVCVVPSCNDLVGDPCFGTLKYLEVDYSCQPSDYQWLKAIACEDTTLSIKCPPCSELIIKSAFYGRLQPGSNLCPHAKINDLQCYRDAITKVAAQCDRKQSCSIAACNGVFQDPCFNTYKYLEINYNCFPINSYRRIGV